MCSTLRICDLKVHPSRAGLGPGEAAAGGAAAEERRPRRPRRWRWRRRPAIPHRHQRGAGHWGSRRGGSGSRGGRGHQGAAAVDAARWRRARRWAAVVGFCSVEVWDADMQLCGNAHSCMGLPVTEAQHPNASDAVDWQWNTIAGSLAVCTRTFDRGPRGCFR